MRTETMIPVTTHETVEAAGRAARLWTAIDALPEKLRKAIILAGIEGHDVREVAALLALPEGTVKSRINRGRTELARQVQRIRETDEQVQRIRVTDEGVTE